LAFLSKANNKKVHIKAPMDKVNNIDQNVFETETDNETTIYSVHMVTFKQKTTKNRDGKTSFQEGGTNEMSFFL
jgi:hypothetical protein